MKTEEKTTNLVEGYQHVSNGGIRFDLDRRDYVHVRVTTGEHIPKINLSLSLGLSNMGVPMVVNIPVFKTTADILQAIVDQIREQPEPTQYEYLSSDYATVRLHGGEPQYYATKNGISSVYDHSELYGGEGTQEATAQESKVQADGDEQSLDELLVLHRISLVPEYESATWAALAYDHDSDTVTREGHGCSPRDAVDAVLMMPIPPEQVE